MIWSGRWEGDSGLGTHVHLWLIHINVWQKQYSIVKQNKVKMKIKKNNKRNNIKILINIPKKILKKEKKYYQKEIQTQTHKELH